MDQDKNVNELNSEKATEAGLREPLDHASAQESDVPLFLRDRAEGQQGNAQDEKDKSAE